MERNGGHWGGRDTRGRKGGIWREMRDTRTWKKDAWIEKKNTGYMKRKGGCW